MYRFPTFRVWVYGLVLAICVTCSVCVAAPSGWICGPSGCRPAPKVAASAPVQMRERRFGDRVRQFVGRVRARFAARRGC